MKTDNKKHHLSRILIFFIMFLFAMGLTMNVFFCSNNRHYELSDKTTVIETQAISESIVSNEYGDDCPLPIIAAIPTGFSLLLFLIIVFLFYLSTLFILLPDQWTLINQKVRLDD